MEANCGYVGSEDESYAREREQQEEENVERDVETRDLVGIIEQAKSIPVPWKSFCLGFQEVYDHGYGQSEIKATHYYRINLEKVYIGRVES